MVTPRIIRVGPAGWAYSDWEGRVYPRRKPQGFHPLSYLAEYVDCVELNVTFYRTPAPQQVARWVDLVEDRPHFRFLAKVGRLFTHEAWPYVPVEEARAFRQAVGPLVEAGRLSALLAQFPFFFRDTPANRERLARLADLFAGLPLVVEARSETWFRPEGLVAIAGLGLGLAHVDLPAARDHPPERHTVLGDVGYVRLHGRNATAWFDPKAGRDEKYDYLYDREELDGVVDRLQEVAGQSRETFLVTNNHYGGQAVANALEIRGLLDGTPPLAPAPLRETFPHLRDLTRSEGQQTFW